MTAIASRHHAPSVQYPVERSRWLGGALGLGSLTGLLVLAAWAVLGASARPWPFIGGCFLLWFLASAGAWHFWVRLPSGTLDWDGQGWMLRSAQALDGRGALAVHLDLQRRMAVCLRQPGGRPLWLWLEQERAPSRWGDLRRAVYSRPGAGIADAAGPAQQQADTV